MQVSAGTVKAWRTDRMITVSSDVDNNILKCQNCTLYDNQFKEWMTNGPLKSAASCIIHFQVNWNFWCLSPAMLFLSFACSCFLKIGVLWCHKGAQTSKVRDSNPRQVIVRPTEIFLWPPCCLLPCKTCGSFSKAAVFNLSLKTEYSGKQRANPGAFKIFPYLNKANILGHVSVIEDLWRCWNKHTHTHTQKKNSFHVPISLPEPILMQPADGKETI